MPKIAVFNYLPFYIVMFDTMGEPPHLHVSNTKSDRTTPAKIWIESLQFAETGNLTQKELNLVQKLVTTNQTELLAALRSSPAW